MEDHEEKRPGVYDDLKIRLDALESLVEIFAESLDELKV